MSQLRMSWIFFSILAKSLEDNMNPAILHRWADTEMFKDSPFGSENIYIHQGVHQMDMWLKDYQKYDSWLERLREDYLQLFIGTPKPLAPAWASHYLEKGHLIFQDSTEAVSRCYRSEGLIAKRENGMPDDYLVYELYYLVALLERYQSAIRSGSQIKAESYVKKTKKFINEYMMTWIPQWREDIMLYARTEYYRALGNMIYGGLEYFEKMEVPL